MMHHLQKNLTSVIQYGNEFADVILVNLCYVCCCLPVFTIGAATSALHAATFSRISGGDGGVRVFLRAFGTDLKQLTPLCVPILLLWAAIAADFFILRTMAVPLSAVAVILLCSALLICAMVSVQLCLLQSRFVCPRSRLVLNAFLIAMRHPVRSWLMVLLQWLPLLLLLGSWRVLFLLLPVFLCGYFWVSSYLCVKIMQRPFAEYARSQPPHP